LAELEERGVGSSLGHRPSSLEEFLLAPIHTPPPLVAFSGPSDDQVDMVMQDAASDRGEVKTDKVVDSKYLQPGWCPPGLTRTQKCKLQLLHLAEMRKRSERSGGMSCSMRSSP
jgi:hypothetical protein